MPQLFQIFEDVSAQNPFARIEFLGQLPNDFRNARLAIATTHNLMRGCIQHQQAFGKKENGIARDRIGLEADVRRQAGTKG